MSITDPIENVQTPLMHEHAEGIEYARITPVDPALTPGQTYAFLVERGGQQAFACDTEEAEELFIAFGKHGQAQADALFAIAARRAKAEERPFLVTQTETFRITATGPEQAIEKLEQMDEEEQNRHYAETTDRYAEEI